MTSHYQRGTAFERQVREDLRERGYTVIRAAGSKGDSKVDLVAISGTARHPLVFLQCKLDGKLGPAERTRIRQVSLWAGALAVVAGKTGPRGAMLEYWRLTGSGPGDREPVSLGTWENPVQP